MKFVLHYFATFALICLACSAQTQNKSTPVSRQAMASLSGHFIYSCKVARGIYADKMNPEYTNVTDENDKPVKPVHVQNYFDTGDKLLIRSASTDMAITPNRDSRFPTVTVTLNIENKENAAWASVKLEVLASLVTPSRILIGITDNVVYSLHPVKDHISPQIGMSKDDVYCRLGVPEHTNSDERAGDQLVYFGGKILVYIDRRTNRVSDVQTFD